MRDGFCECARRLGCKATLWRSETFRLWTRVKFVRDARVHEREDRLRRLTLALSSRTAKTARDLAPGSQEREGSKRVPPSGAAELIFFPFEEKIEGGERSIAASDVLLHLHL